MTTPNLAALLAAATPRPWRQRVRSGKTDGIEGGSGFFDDVIVPGRVECMAYCYGGSSTTEGDRMEADLALIVALVNAADTWVSERAELEERVRAAEALHRDLASRLGFGNNITEPMADNDTIVRHVEEGRAQLSDLREYRYACPLDCPEACDERDWGEHCVEHNVFAQRDHFRAKSAAAEAREAALRAGVKRLASEWERKYADHIEAAAVADEATIAAIQVTAGSIRSLCAKESRALLAEGVEGQ